MRVAALYDIHGNLPALESVLQEIEELQIDRMVIGGDIVPGPMPREVLNSLLSLDVAVEFIYGNCEVAMLEQMAGRHPAGLPESYRPIMQWTAQQMAPHERTFAAWPKTVTLRIPDLGEVLFCHGTPRDENEIFTRRTPEDRLLPIFNELRANLVVCGHTHMQFDRMIGKTRVVNAGSVGMPFGEPGAYWLLLGPDLQLRRTSYDLATAANRIRGTGYPGAEEFASQYVLQRPSEQTMLDLYTEAGLK